MDNARPFAGIEVVEFGQFIGGEKRIDDLRTPDKVAPLITIESPSTGTVISRSVNMGEVVMEGKELFRIADLSSVWVMGQVYENDFALVRVGTQASITTPAFPGKTFTGRISYIDPRVDPATRTAQVRIEVANPSEALRLGMFVDVRLGDAPQQSGQGVVVPRSAIQSLGAKQVVYIATGEAGVKGADSPLWFGIWGPAKVTANIVNKINADVRKALADPVVKERLQNAGNATMDMSPQEFARFVRSEIDTYQKVIKDAGIKPQ